MILPTTAKHTDGICMPCFNKEKHENEKEAAEAEREHQRQNAVVVSTGEEEEDFLWKVATYCDLDCCGWDAIQIEKKLFRSAVEKIGKEKSVKVLDQMKRHLSAINGHSGYVKFRGYYENSISVIQGYSNSIGLLEKILKAEPDDGDNVG